MCRPVAVTASKGSHSTTTIDFDIAAQCTRVRSFRPSSSASGVAIEAMTPTTRKASSAQDFPGLLRNADFTASRRRPESAGTASSASKMPRACCCAFGTSPV